MKEHVNEETISKHRIRTHLKRLVPCLLLSLAVAFLLTLFAPLELYFTNIDEFDFDFYALFPELLKMFLLAFLSIMVGFAACRVVYCRLYDLVLLIGLSGLICTYVQGLFLAGNLPPLDGTGIDWSLYRIEDVKSVVLWFVVLLAIVLLTRLLHMQNMRKVVSGLSAFFLAMLMVTLVTVGIQNQGFQHKSQVVVSKNQEFQMSSDQNMIIFVLDAVDSGTLRNLMEGEDGYFSDILEDFTYYPNTVGAYTFTQMSIPYILTGQWFENKQDFPSYYTAALESSPLLTILQSQNYRIGLYEEDLEISDEQAAQVENLVDTSMKFSSFTGLLKAEIKLVWFKYAPFPLKRLVSVNMDVFRDMLVPSDGSELFQYLNYDFYSDVQNAQVRTVDDKCFKFIHVEGAHVPLRYDKDVNIIDNGSYPQNVECSMTVLKAYLQRLKDAGVYDNSAIVVMADHGYGIYWDDGLLGRSNPLLAVKGVGESHAMQISEAPISYEDLQESFSRLLSGKDSTQVFDAREGDQRQRRYLLYSYLEENHMEEYIQTGYATDLSGFQKTGVVYDAPHP